MKTGAPPRSSRCRPVPAGAARRRDVVHGHVRGAVAAELHHAGGRGNGVPGGGVVPVDDAEAPGEWGIGPDVVRVAVEAVEGEHRQPYARVRLVLPEPLAPASRTTRAVTRGRLSGAHVGGHDAAVVAIGVVRVW